MRKIILIHRETGGLEQPISTHRRRGSAVIYMLMVWRRWEWGRGRGPRCVASWGVFFERLWCGTVQQIQHHGVKTICWSSSGPARSSVCALLNQAWLLHAPPPPSLAYSLTGLFIHKLVFLMYFLLLNLVTPKVLQFGEVCFFCQLTWSY